MLDPQLLRTDPEAVAEALKPRGYELDVAAWRELESRRKELQIRVQELQNQKNQSAKSIGQAKARGEDIQPLLEDVRHLGEKLGQSESEFNEVRTRQQAWLLEMPNLALPDVPQGADENDNVEIRKWGEPTQFDFEPRGHVELGEGSGMLDAPAAAKLAGTRFVVLKGDLSRMHRALAQFMLDVHTQEHGYMEVYLPYLVNAETMTGTGQLPKFEDDAFATTDDPPRYLIPTAEVPMTNLVAGDIIDADDLPLRFTSQTPCFRREAGSYGKDTRGIIRQHQFEKVEMVQIVRPENSDAALDDLTGHAESILQRLGVPYRVIILCTGDMGFASARTLVHTLNGSGLAVGRTLIAVMENYQQQDGSIKVPEVLRPYMAGQEFIL